MTHTQDFKKINGKNILIVAQQKGKNWEECKNRVDKAIDLVDKLKNKNNVFLMVVGGANNGVPREVIKSWIPEIEGLNQIIIDNIAGNTKEKGNSIANFVKDNEISIVYQCTSLYHSLRAYLTLMHSLKSLNLKNLPKVYNVPSDAVNENEITYYIYDILILAKNINPDLLYSVNVYELLTIDIKHDSITMSIIKYLSHRVGEANRISLYSEKGKNHLVTKFDVKDVISSYML